MESSYIFSPISLNCKSIPLWSSEAFPLPPVWGEGSEAFPLRCEADPLWGERSEAEPYSPYSPLGRRRGFSMPLRCEAFPLPPLWAPFGEPKVLLWRTFGERGSPLAPLEQGERS